MILGVSAFFRFKSVFSVVYYFRYARSLDYFAGMRLIRLLCGGEEIRGKNMKNRKQLYLPVIFSVFLCTVSAFCLDLEKEFKQEIAMYRIRPDQTVSMRRDEHGLPVTEAKLKQSVREFYDRLYLLDSGFFKPFKVKSFVFKDTLYGPDGDQVSVKMLGDTFYFDVDMDDSVFYTLLFLLQEINMSSSYKMHWQKLNPDAFSYEDSRGNLSKNSQKKLDAVLAEWDKYFVTRMAMYAWEYDMAETFSFMLTRGPAAMAFARENSPVILKKYAMVSESLVSVKALPQGYMETLISDDLSKLKAFSPYALSVRLWKEFSGEWSASGSGGADRGVDDPVEVAGRKVTPLVLALETKNNRLFKLLMERGADPNVANGKKFSALMLAIANNNTEQVKLLLKAGAKVTPEAARAGTASGVSMEIVKMLNSYLPGVRQSDPPEKKNQAKSSGTAGAGDASGKALQKRLKEMKYDHLELEEVALSNVIQLIRGKSKSLMPGTEGVRIVIPQEYAQAGITIVVDDASFYEILQLICRKFGFEMRIEDPSTVILSAPGSGKTESGKKSGSAKKQQ